jgi:dinuclear metal center YbgI/SA1388 family protein
MHMHQLMAALEICAPLEGAEPWDNVGLLLGHPQDDIHKALVTIDLTPQVLAEAQAFGAQLVVAYHPTWFGAKKRLVHEDLILQAARAGLCIYSPHTALDSAQGGTNDVLAHAAGLPLGAGEALAPRANATPQSPGMGRVGTLPAPMDVGPWLHALKAAMGVGHALLAEPKIASLGPIRRVAVCAGAGDDMVERALAAQADTFVVGELRHHQALHCLAQKMRVVALLHSGSERAALVPYARKLQQLAPSVTFRVSTIDADPYVFA